MKRSILVFAKYPEPGFAKRRLTPPLSREAAAALASAFLRDTCANLRPLENIRKTVSFTPLERESELRRLVGSGFELEPQVDGDLGQRMRGAAERALADGGAVVLLGADTPTLPVRRIEAAFAALERTDTDVVLGPTVDCGYYLLGFKTVRRELFESMEWGTPAVLPSTLSVLRSLGLAVEVLEPWFDVDRAADLDFLRCHLEILALKGQLTVGAATRDALPESR